MVQKDVNNLIHALKDENRDVQERAKEELKNIGEKAIKPLIQAFEDDDENIREFAAFALQDIRESVAIDKKSVKPLIHALKNRNGTVRQVALGTLIKIGRPAVKSLIQALDDEDDSSSGLVVWAIKDIVDKRDKKVVEPLIRAMNRFTCRLRASSALIKIGEPAVEHLIGLLKHEDKEVRQLAIEALGEIRDNRAVEPVLYILNQAMKEYGNSDIRDTAISALKKINKPPIEPFIEALKNENWVIRQVAAEVLGNLGDKKAIFSLTQVLDDEMKEVRQAATESLEKLGHKITLLKWTLDIENKNIEIRIDTDQFILETPDCKIQFEICFSIAYQMLGQLRAVVTPPNIPKQSLGEEINGKTLIMGLILGQNDHWIINLQYGNDNFYAELTLNDIYKIGTVLDRYLN